MELSQRQREIIGRGAMLVFFGLLPIWGGIKCIRAAQWLDADVARQQASRPTARHAPSGSGLPYTLGAILILVGGTLSLASVLPVSVFERVIGPPRNNTLWEKPNTPLPLDQRNYGDW